MIMVNRCIEHAARRWMPLAGVLLVMCGLPLAPRVRAVTITDARAVNVTPSGFTVIWSVTENSNPSLVVCADAQGKTNLAGTVGLEYYPLNGGNPQAENIYLKRQDAAFLRDQTKGLGLVMARVTGCRPATPYYYRVIAKAATGPAAQYPESGPLPGITTAQGNSFLADAKQMLLTIPGSRILGRIVTLASTNAPYPLAAVVGDGADTNQVYFNLSELLSSNSQSNYTAAGDQQFKVELLGPPVGEAKRDYTLTFGTNFVVAYADERSFVLDSLALSFGERVLYAGSGSYIPVTLSCNVAITNVTVDLDLAVGRLANLSVAPSGISGAVFQLTGGRGARLNLIVDPKKTYLASTEVARLNFQAVAGQSSAILPVAITALSAHRPNGVPMEVVAGLNGRIIVVGAQPLLEALRPPEGGRSLVVYGHEGISYRLESTANLRLAFWPGVLNITLTNIAHRLDGLMPIDQNRFYRAREQ